MSDHPQFNRGQIRAALLPDLLISVVAPILIYRFAVSSLSQTNALLFASVPPFIRVGYTLIRSRRLNFIGVLSLFSVALKIFFALVLKNARLVLVSDSFITGVYGILLLASLLSSQPLLLNFIGNMVANASPEQAQRFLHRWSQPDGRSMLKMITIIWGIGLLLECVVQVLLAFTLTVGQVVLFSPILRYCMLGVLLLWTFFFTRRLRAPNSETPNGVSSKAVNDPSGTQFSHQ